MRQELVGLMVEVVDAKNKSLVGIKGVVIDETRSLLFIGEKKVVKSQVVIESAYNGKKVRVDGKRLVGRPEERLKRIKK